MNGFELDRLDREVDALLADVKGGEGRCVSWLWGFGS